MRSLGRLTRNKNKVPVSIFEQTTFQHLLSLLSVFQSLVYLELVLSDDFNPVHCESMGDSHRLPAKIAPTAIFGILDGPSRIVLEG